MLEQVRHQLRIETHMPREKTRPLSSNSCVTTRWYMLLPVGQIDRWKQKGIDAPLKCFGDPGSTCGARWVPSACHSDHIKAGAGSSRLLALVDVDAVGTVDPTVAAVTGLLEADGCWLAVDETRGGRPHGRPRRPDSNGKRLHLASARSAPCGGDRAAIHGQSERARDQMSTAPPSGGACPSALIRVASAVALVVRGVAGPQRLALAATGQAGRRRRQADQSGCG